MVVESEQLDIFELENFQMIIQYKWDFFAKHLQYRGLLAHLFYVCVNILYINSVYINDAQDEKAVFIVLLFVAIIYPTGFELF